MGIGQRHLRNQVALGSSDIHGSAVFAPREFTSASKKSRADLGCRAQPPPQRFEILRVIELQHADVVQEVARLYLSLKFLERRNGRYYNTPSTDFFLDKRKTSYIGGILEMANHRLNPFWTHLTTALRTRLPQNETRDGSRSLSRPFTPNRRGSRSS
jgi:hypothetical protein